MKEFLLVYRKDYSFMPEVSKAEMEAMSKKWMDWIDSIAAQNQLVSRGNRLFNNQGKVVKAKNVVTDGPYTEIKESIGGYSIVRAASYEAAVELTKGCPILTMDGNVEVREISPL